MLRARVRSAYTVRLHSTPAAVDTADVSHHSNVVLNKSNVVLVRSASGTGLAALTEPKRFSFKYARKQQTTEMRQPAYIHDKRYGIFDNERNIAKARRGLPFITPLYTKHMGLWETDTDASTNRFFRSYVFGQRELHQLLGRPHAFESDEAGGRQGDTAYEVNTDMRYKGIAQPAITNLHYEPEWNQTLYRNTAHGNQLTNPRSPLTREVLGDELMAVRDAKSVEHCKAWFDRLQYLIKLHYDAVGDIGEFKSRHTQHVHEFFVMFHDAISSFDFQDTYLLEHFQKTRPKELEDIFGIFLEMEANYVNEDHCPRCSLPYATTRFCGEGDANTPFRKHRGRWAPHQRWGHEWYDVVMRRSEALWYRATEDPYFGTTEHTQRQVEAMLRVYVQTKQRAKAIDFIHGIRGSKEFLMGRVSITDAMQASLDKLLDSTPHQHLLTNSFQVEGRDSLYTGAVNKVPQSPLQTRLDLEMNKYRRQQKEEGVVRVPPAQWTLDTSSIVPYKMDQSKRITNWREVKEGIEKSFLASGLPKEAYTSREWCEMLYWKDFIASAAQRRAALETERQTEVAKFGSRSHVLFPDKSWYRVFDTSAEALRPFGVSASGLVFTANSTTYDNPAAVPFTDVVSGANMKIDTTAETCKIYGDYESGDVLRLTPADGSGKAFTVVVVGVNTAGAEGEWALYGMHTVAAEHASKGLVELGKNCLDVKDRFTVESTGTKAVVSVLDAARVAREEHLGQVVGVRNGQLHVQWRLVKGGGGELARSVAVNIGSPEMVQQCFRIKELSAEPLTEPPSWLTPFRNEFAEERLKELETAPFSREKWASLIPGKFTPKVKKFGYTQHTTQDDFVTKEYKDRLLARQYFHNPQAFEVLPERKEKSVQFQGKWEYQRTQGMPTVDRNELENGWGTMEPISNDEMHVIEQALRDISGYKPGNFVKSATETSSLQLNETWWKPLEYGWQERNREQSLLDPSEQKMIDSSRLPFAGKTPPFGTSYGIGERIRDIAEDYAKGFGLGPHSHSPGHNTARFNTLGAEDERVRTLGLSNALVRLFDQKLGLTDPHVWALEQCGRDEANVRHVLLSLQEWREKGRKPSLLLATILNKYLKDELDVFNSGLPANVPRLEIREGGAAGNIWADVDKSKYAQEYAAQRPHTDTAEAYIPSLVQRANVGDKAPFSDVAYVSHLQQEVALTLQHRLAEIAGKDIPASMLAQLSNMEGRPERSSGNVVPYVRVSEVAKLLTKMQVSSENVAVVTRGLSNCPEHVKLGDDIIVPVSLISTWSGPQQSASNVALAASNTGSRGNNRTAGASAVSKALHMGGGSAAVGGEDKMVVHVLEELALRNDGLAMDIKYTIRENKRNPVLRQEFFNAFLPVFAKNHKKVGELYEDYCDGKYVPNITVAIDAFIAFLANTSKNPDSIPSAVPYFETDSNGRHAGQYTQVKLLPPTVGSFVFDNVKAERIETAELFSKYGISAGPTRAAATGFIAANNKAFNYFANRRDASVVYVTPKDDQGLKKALESSAHYSAIAANPKLKFMLQSPNGIGLIVAFNRYFQRVAPMLNFYRGVLQEYRETVSSLQYTAQNANRGLARALENEAATNIEQDFRRNVERYWRNVLEGRGNNENEASAGSAAPQQRQQQRAGGQQGSSSASSPRDGSSGGDRRNNQQRRVPANSGGVGGGLSRALGGSSKSGAAPRSTVKGVLDIVGKAKASQGSSAAGAKKAGGAGAGDTKQPQK